MSEIIFEVQEDEVDGGHVATASTLLRPWSGAVRASHYSSPARDGEESTSVRLYGNPEAIVVAAMLTHKDPLSKTYTCESTLLVIRECQQLHPLGRSEDSAVRHRFGA